MRLRAGLGDVMALFILGASAVLAGALLWLPQLSAKSEKALPVLGLGLLGYLTYAALAAFEAGEPESLRTVGTVREAMADHLARLRKRDKAGEPSPLTTVIEDALRQFDKQIVPVLKQLVGQHDALAGDLKRIDSGRVPAPDPAIMRRLRERYAEQAVAIAMTLQQAANAHATLVLLIQEAHEPKVAADAKRWFLDLVDIYEGMIEVLHGSEALSPAPAPVAVPVQVDLASPISIQRVQRPNPGSLTNREAEVLRLLGRGYSAKEIAALLVLSVATVQRHVANIYTKINARGRVEAIRWGMENGVITLNDDDGPAAS